MFTWLFLVALVLAVAGLLIYARRTAGSGFIGASQFAAWLQRPAHSVPAASHRPALARRDFRAVSIQCGPGACEAAFASMPTAVPMTTAATFTAASRVRIRTAMSAVPRSTGGQTLAMMTSPRSTFAMPDGLLSEPLCCWSASSQEVFMRSIAKWLLAFAAVIPMAAQADPAPVQLSVLEFNAPDTREVRGARLAVLYGESGSVTGVDFALGLSDVENLKGVSFPLWLGANRVRNEMTGLAMGIVNLHEGSDTGVNLGGLNLVNDVNGLNLGIANIAGGSTLADVSFVNVSESSTFQLAWVNVTDEINGVQIGLINCAKNGFFPCFPIFNFAK